MLKPSLKNKKVKKIKINVESKLRASFNKLDAWLKYRDIDKKTKITGHYGKPTKVDIGHIF